MIGRGLPSEQPVGRQVMIKSSARTVFRRGASQYPHKERNGHRGTEAGEE